MKELTTAKAQLYEHRYKIDSLKAKLQKQHVCQCEHIAHTIQEHLHKIAYPKNPFEKTESMTLVNDILTQLKTTRHRPNEQIYEV